MHLIKFGDAPASSPSLLFISDKEPLLSTAGLWGESFGEDFLLYVPDAALPKPDAVESFVATLRQAANQVGIRRTTIFGIGPGATVAMALAMLEPRIIRRLVLLDATSRIAPSWFERAVDRIETILPLGLPFRSVSRNFDVRPTLHLLHCPTLVLSSPEAERFVKEQAELIVSRIPNSYLCLLENSPFVGDSKQYAPSEELLLKLHEFLQLPVKFPQKNRYAL